MNLRTAAISIVVFAITTVFAQGTSPASPAPVARTNPQRRSPDRRWRMPSSVENKTSGVQNPVAFRQSLQDMQTTLENMHAVLKRMQAKASASRSKDPLVKANLDMWELMVSHLDKQLQQLQTAEVARRDLEARRAAMYKQADAKAEAAARAGQAAQSSRFGEAPGLSSGTQNPASSPAEKPPASQIPAPPTTPSSK